MKLLILCFLLFSTGAYAAYYDVLPKGVRNLTYQYTLTGEITGRYTNSGNLQGYNINANINADSIKGINSAVDTYLGTLSAEDYKKFLEFQDFVANEKRLKKLDEIRVQRDSLKTRLKTIENRIYKLYGY